MTNEKSKQEFIAQAKAWKQRNPEIKRGTKISKPDKAEAVRIFRLGKSLGCGVKTTAKSIGLGLDTAYRWMRDHKSPAAKSAAKPTKPARVARARVKLKAPEPAQPTVTIETANGIKVHGLTYMQAAELLAVLG
jgi:hypothetical protein